MTGRIEATPQDKTILKETLGWKSITYGVYVNPLFDDSIYLSCEGSR